MNGESWYSLTWRGREVGIWNAREGSCRAAYDTQANHSRCPHPQNCCRALSLDRSG